MNYIYLKIYNIYIYFCAYSKKIDIRNDFTRTCSLCAGYTLSKPESVKTH